MSKRMKLNDTRLRELRAGKGWTLEKAGEECGIGSSKIGSAENARSKTALEDAKAIAKVYGVDLEEIIDRPDHLQMRNLGVNFNWKSKEGIASACLARAIKVTNEEVIKTGKVLVSEKDLSANNDMIFVTKEEFRFLLVQCDATTDFNEETAADGKVYLLTQKAVDAIAARIKADIAAKNKPAPTKKITSKVEISELNKRLTAIEVGLLENNKLLKQLVQDKDVIDLDKAVTSTLQRKGQGRLFREGDTTSDQSAEGASH